MDGCIVIPVYNEGKRAVVITKEVLKVVNGLVVIVDDGSSDNSLKLLNKAFGKNPRVTVINHVVNLGKGAALKTGLKMAWKLDCEAVVFIDADCQHDPKFLPQFIEKLEYSPLVFGYRELKRDAPWVRRVGNDFAAWLIGVLFNIKRKDILCGFWGFRKEIYNKIKWKSSRYEIETEVSTKVGKYKLPYSEIKINTTYIDKYKGVTILDAMKILLKIPIWYFGK